MEPRRTMLDVRQSNRASILRSIFSSRMQTRTELIATTGLSQGTISTLVTELQAERIVRETGTIEESDGGRPRQLLELNPSFAAVIGIDVGDERVRAEAFTLHMEQLAYADETLVDLTDVPLVFAAIERTVREVLRAASLSEHDVLGAGIAVPGMVEHDNEKAVVHAQTIGWHDVPIGATVSALFSFPLVVGNGAKTMGQAESWLGAARGATDVVAALVATGLGASVVSEGRPLQGVAHSAGEWGHGTIDIDGRTCRCGATGCLEAYVGAESALARLDAVAGGAAPSGTAIEARLAELVELSHSQPALREVLDDIIKHLGAGLGNLVNMFNPERIVIGGWWGLILGAQNLEAIREQTSHWSLEKPFAQTQIVLGELGPDSVAIGAAMLPLSAWLANGGRRAEAPRSRNRGARTANPA